MQNSQLGVSYLKCTWYVLNLPLILLQVLNFKLFSGPTFPFYIVILVYLDRAYVCEGEADSPCNAGQGTFLW